MSLRPTSTTPQMIGAFLGLNIIALNQEPINKCFAFCHWINEVKERISCNLVLVIFALLGKAFKRYLRLFWK